MTCVGSFNKQGSSRVALNTHPFTEERGNIIPVSEKAQDRVIFCFHIQTPGSETK